MRAILLALIELIWCVGLAGTATTRGNGGGGSGGGGDKNAGQMLESKVLEAADLAAVVAERETSQQLGLYAEMYPEGSELRCALAYGARPAGPGGQRSKGCQVASSQKRYSGLVRAKAVNPQPDYSYPLPAPSAPVAERELSPHAGEGLKKYGRDLRDVRAGGRRQGRRGLSGGAGGAGQREL